MMSLHCSDPCSSCKTLIGGLGYSKVSDRFCDNRYLNWMKACLVLQYAKEGMEVFAKQVAKEFHSAIVRNVTDKLGRNTCPGCDVGNRRKGKKLQCPQEECGTWIEVIEDQICQQNGKSVANLNWGNTDLKGVKQNGWDLAKLFQKDGCRSHTGPEQADIAAMLALFSNCSYFDRCLNCNQRVKEVRDTRNKLFHSESMKIVEESILELHINKVLGLLQYPDRLKNEETCKRMIEKIERVRDNKVTPGAKEEQLIMSENVSVMMEEKNAYQQQLQNATTSEEYRDIQEKIKGIEEVSHRLKCFVDMNLIDEPDTLKDLCSIKDTAREIYLEAERRLFEQSIHEKILREVTPGKPRLIRNKPDRIKLSWSEPKRFDRNSCHYEVRCEDKFNGIKWEENVSYENTHKAYFRQVKGNARLRFQVRVLTKGPYSEMSDEIQTIVPGRLRLLETAELFKDGYPAVYTLPMTENHYATRSDGSFRQFEIGSPTSSTEVVNIWLFGERESVTTAIVNDMLNYIFGIRWDDRYRFTVEKADRSHRQQESRNYNHPVTEYIINPHEDSRIQCKVSIIVIPVLNGGFGEKRQIFELFNTKRDVGAICILIEKCKPDWMVEWMLMLLPSDLKTNMCALIVPCYEAHPSTRQINQVLLEKCFGFGNTWLFSGRFLEWGFGRYCWEPDLETYGDIFDFARRVKTKTTDESVRKMREFFL